jgi:hypothetical protein
MTLIVDILARAARQCSVTPPTSWLTSAQPVAREVIDFLEETADDVLERVDVTAPVGKMLTITGTGDEFYPLPADYKRLMRGEFAVYERFRTRRACVPVSDDGQWEYIKELGTAGAYRFFRVRGYDGQFSIGFQRPLEPGITVVLHYVSKNWIGGDKALFTAEEDVSIFPRRLMESGIVFRFRERKGLEFADKQAEYEALLARMINDTRTRRVINFGAVPTRQPWDIPVPDFIP